MNAGVIYGIAAWVVPLVIAIVFHEVAHGWAALALGDPTARDARRLSLNPLRHIDPVGTVLLPLGLALAHAPVFGWAKPVPVRFDRLRHPRRDKMLVALAGPATNLVLGMIAAIGYVVLAHAQPGWQTLLRDNLGNFLLLNVFLAMFNLLPIPPFDGSRVVEGLLPDRLARAYAALGRYGFVLLIGLLVVLPMLAPQANIVARLVLPPAGAVVGALLHLASAIV